MPSNATIGTSIFLNSTKLKMAKKPQDADLSPAPKNLLIKKSITPL
jgi:hypothetical protein